MRRLGIRIPVARLAVTFILSRPNYKRSLELLLLMGPLLKPNLRSRLLCVVVFSVVARYPVDLLYYYFSISKIFLVVCYSHKINPTSHLSSIYLYFLSCKSYFFIFVRLMCLLFRLLNFFCSSLKTIVVCEIKRFGHTQMFDSSLFSEAIPAGCV